MWRFDPELERRRPEIRQAEQFLHLRALLSRASAEAPGWRRRLAGIDVDGIAGPQDLANLPLLRKSDLPALQQADPPFGGLTLSMPGRLARLYLSPGPIADPEGSGPDWWGAARAFHALGLKPGDVVHNAFSYHLTPAGTLFESGAHALGCAVIPAGTGGTEGQLDAMARFRPTAYCGTPDFLKILIDKAGETGRDIRFLTRALVSGAALPPSLRATLEGHGLTVRQAFGTADLGIVAHETGAPEDGMVVGEEVIVEIVAPGTGEPLPDGEVGELVVTRLNADYPLFRFATGDLSAFMTEPVADGRTNRRIRGWMGRADQATKVRGMFVRPEQIAEIGRRHPGLKRLRLVVTRADERDEMLLLAESADTAIDAALRDTLADVTKLKGAVTVVAPGTLPRDGKVISDERG